MKPLPIDFSAYFAYRQLYFEQIGAINFQQRVFQFANLCRAISNAVLVTAARLLVACVVKEPPAKHAGLCLNLVCAAVSKL